MPSQTLIFEYQSKNNNEGLSPTIAVINPNGTTVVSAGTAMTHAGFGRYYYEYTATVKGLHIAQITCSAELIRPTTDSVYATLDESDALVTNSYTTVTKVEGFLHLTTLSSSTTPTSTQVQTLIAQAEDKIDSMTNHAWRLRYSGTNAGEDTTQRYEYKDVFNTYDHQTGIPVYLNRRMVRSFDSGESDALDVWDGSEWIDYLATMTEGRADDFWVDYDTGIIYFKKMSSIRGPIKVRTKYRYGEETVPRAIEEVATKLVAIDLLMTDNTSVLVPEGMQTPFSQKVTIWERQIKETLKPFREIRMITNIL